MLCWASLADSFSRNPVFGETEFIPNADWPRPGDLRDKCLGEFVQADGWGAPTLGRTTPDSNNSVHFF